MMVAVKFWKLVNTVIFPSNFCKFSSPYRFISRLIKWLDVSDHYNNMHPLSPTTPTSFKEVAGPGNFLATILELNSEAFSCKFLIWNSLLCRSCSA